MKLLMMLAIIVGFSFVGCNRYAEPSSGISNTKINGQAVLYSQQTF